MRRLLRALEKEGEYMLAAAPSDAFKIALCIEGEQMSSEKLSKTLNYAGMQRQNGSVYRFIIRSVGAPEGRMQAAYVNVAYDISSSACPVYASRTALPFI